jgi:toxin FitB
MYVLDTNVLSELRPGKAQQSQEVRAWAAGVPDGQFFVSAVTILEQEMGILQLERRTPPEGKALRAWFEAMRKAFAGRVLSFTGEVAMRCAALHVPNRMAFRDSMIAATTMEHGLTLATRNVRDFQGTGVKLINPWEQQ